jgi:hypothetical protein
MPSCCWDPASGAHPTAPVRLVNFWQQGKHDFDKSCANRRNFYRRKVAQAHFVWCLKALLWSKKGMQGFSSLILLSVSSRVLSALFSLPDDRYLGAIHRENDGRVLVLRSSQTRAGSPHCTQPSSHGHGRSMRRLSARPGLGNVVRISLDGRRFACRTQGGSPHHRCGTLPNAGAPFRSANAPTSPLPHSGRVR